MDEREPATGRTGARVGATVLVRDDTGALLLVRPPRETEWRLPGGVAYAGETIAGAAARDLAEETGLVLDVVFFAALGVAPHGRAEGGRAGFNLVGDGGTVDAKEAARVAVPEGAEDRVAELRWVPLDQLGEHASALGTWRIRQALAAFAHGRQPLLLNGLVAA
ncbi:NUDIX domain-containing protein [Streptomyces sp. NBC_00102]|uniref:NUDIX domain-containing protein n=1 Tax=Streptomyces sp. NBC_00102 TaxID=2975652 RepID=UPI002252F0F5|nr:NUDIX hydrolase [Streptomyces sp. NBC_00102]MCX5398491.1 NUDIX hydrolase [Streptomyces sp. NBC_00102]